MTSCWGRKHVNVEKVLAFGYFLKGPRTVGADQGHPRLFSLSKNIYIHALRRYLEACFLYECGVHFHKIIENDMPELKNAAERSYIVSVMGIHVGLVGQRAGMLNTCWF